MIRFALPAVIVVALPLGPSARSASPSYESCATQIDPAALTSPQHLECATGDIDRADHALNTAYRATMARLAPGRQATLRQEQRAWIDRRRARCALETQAADPSRDLNRMLCLVTETDDRTAALRAMH